MKAAPPCVAMEPTCAKRPEVMIGATEPSACIEKASTMALLPGGHSLKADQLPQRPAL